MSKVQLKVEGMPAPLGAYSDAIQAGDMIFLAGQAGLDADGNVVGDTAAAQARQAFTNLQALLAGIGLTLDAVVKTTIFLTDITEFEEVNAAYKEFFKAPYPARETVQVAGLAHDLRFEMAVTAYKG